MFWFVSFEVVVSSWSVLETVWVATLRMMCLYIYIYIYTLDS